MLFNFLELVLLKMKQKLDLEVDKLMDKIDVLNQQMQAFVDEMNFSNKSNSSQQV